MKSFYALVLGLSICLSASSQDWVNDKSNLYYFSHDGEVFIQPDYSGMVVYFKETPSLNIKSNFLKSVATKSSTGTSIKEDAVKLMEFKNLMKIESVENLPSISNPKERASFLTNFNLTSQGAYEVLPKFEVNGQEISFTKRVIVSLDDNTTVDAISNLLDKYGAKFLRTTTNASTLLLEVEEIENQLPLIQDIHESGLLKWGQPDFTVQLVHHDDPLYPEQFQMNNVGGTLDGLSLTPDIDIDAPEAWEITTGNNSITVAVIDDGVESHPDLPNIVAGLTPANNGNGTPTNSGAHGVSCAGIIAAQHNDIGVRGVAPNVDLITVNIFQGSETIQDLVDAFDFAVAEGADVISNSWGFSGNCSSDLYPSITDAINNAALNGRGGLGCPILFSSGNDFNTCVSYPSTIDNVLSVGALSPDGDISIYSNQGSLLDIVAPSNDINDAFTAYIYGVRTTDRTGNSGYESGDYTTGFGGTSAACPAVAGVAALVLSVNGALTSSEVYDILTSTADDMGSNGFDNTYGYGRVNAYGAVLAAGGSAPTTCDLAAPGNFSASGITQSSFTLSWNGVAGSEDYTVTINGSSTTVSGTSYSATGLSSGTTYSCSVVANCEDGSGASSSINVTTSGDAPDCSDVTIDSNDIDAGWGIWNDGGSDTRRGQYGDYSNGTHSIWIRDDSNTSSITTDALDLSSYEEITVSFNYIGSGMENGEDFFLEVSTDGGSSYNEISSWVANTDFVNETWYAESATTSGSFSGNTILRFRCDASANDDRVYLDDIVISGCSAVATTTAGVTTMNNTSVINTFDFNNVVVYPNPIQDIVNIQNIPTASTLTIVSLSGQVVKQSKGVSSLNVSDLNTGIYILQVTVDGESRTYRISKQ